jgi:hypothetical protein
MVNNIDVGETKGSNLNLRRREMKTGGGSCDSKIVIRLSYVNSEFRLSYVNSEFSFFRRNGIASA